MALKLLVQPAARPWTDTWKGHNDNGGDTDDDVDDDDDNYVL